jgi:hypothetical protein
MLPACCIIGKIRVRFADGGEPVAVKCRAMTA